MDDSLGGFIRRHRHLAEEDAFRKFLDLDAVRDWAAQDEARRERLRVEFHRVWVTEAVPAAPVAPPAPVEHGKHGPGFAGPPQVETAARAHARAETVVAPPPPAPPAPAPRGAPVGDSSFMCPNCAGIDIVSAVEGKRIRVFCQDCNREFQNMLELIPVERVGALEFVFGTGWRAAAGPAAILAIFLGLYLLLRWMRAW